MITPILKLYFANGQRTRIEKYGPPPPMLYLKVPIIGEDGKETKETKTISFERTGPTTYKQREPKKPEKAKSVPSKVVTPAQLRAPKIIT